MLNGNNVSYVINVEDFPETKKIEGSSEQCVCPPLFEVSSISTVMTVTVSRQAAVEEAGVGVYTITIYPTIDFRHSFNSR
jgi:hypothetical protein